MTSQERVLTSLKHQPPDHVSVNLPGDLSSGTAAMAYPKLRTTTKTQELASVARALRSNPIVPFSAVSAGTISQLGLALGFASITWKWTSREPCWQETIRRNDET